MAADDLNILCTGDLHLGRHPTRIPAELDGQSFSPKRVWRDTVDLAVERSVDAVLISGDVVDRENRYLEAYGPFEAGATRLDEAGIPTVVVAGNHDFDVLPQLVNNLDLEHLSLIGAEETWERKSIPSSDEVTFHIDGWSFAHEHVQQSPLDSYDQSSTEEPVIGLLHADLGVPDSDYAPVERAALESTSVDAWILGHIHAPGVQNESEPLVMYPGSPQPLDPGEPGEHGPWLLEYSTASGVTVDQVPQATVRYEELSVDVDGMEDWKSVPSVAREAIDDMVTESIATRALELLAVRLEFTGRTECHRGLVEQRTDIEDDLEFKQGALSIRVDDVEINTQPAVDLEELADEDTPVGYLAEILLDLEHDQPGEDTVELIEGVNRSIQGAYSAGTYSPLRREGRIDDPEFEDAATVLRQQARVTLDELLAQTESEL